MNTPPPAEIKKAMILAAGLGTRFAPWTNSHPKALAIVNGKSLLQRNIEYLQAHGIRDVVVNVHHFAQQVIDALAMNNGWGSKITISDETDQVLETGGGLKKARPFLDQGPFVMMNADILTDLDLSKLIRDHFQHRPLATLAVTDRTTSRYFLFDEQMELCGWRNTKTGQERIARPVPLTPGPTASTTAPVANAAAPELITTAPTANTTAPATDTPGPVAAPPAPGPPRPAERIPKAFSGIHVIDPAIFPLISQEGKFSIVDVYLDLAVNQAIRGFDHSQTKFVDVGKPESVAKAAALFP
jgi:N-acetyl-alpha-D-muramate 1-phosphate uridylyltransferase